MTQPSLLDGLARREKPWRRVRPTSIAQYAHLRDTGTLSKRRDDVLRTLAAIKNATGRWPTSCEIQQWMVERGDLPPDGNPNHVRPRLTELVKTGVVRRGPKRPSTVTTLTVLTWEVTSR